MFFEAIRHPKVRAALDQPWLFKGVRSLIIGNQAPTRRFFRDHVKVGSDDRVLDVCCGTGDFAEMVGASEYYLGIDANREFIASAKRRFGGDASRQFSVMDATRMQFPSRSFDKVLFVNALHHFPESLVTPMLKEMARVVRGEVIILDLHKETPSPVRRFLMACDRGDHVRPLAEQRRLIASLLAIEEEGAYTVGLSAQTYFICRPKASTERVCAASEEAPAAVSRSEAAAC